MQEKNHTIDKCRAGAFGPGNDISGGRGNGGRDGNQTGPNVDERTGQSGKNRWLRIWKGTNVRKDIRV